MRRKESLYPMDWFKIGDKELERANNLLSLDDLEGAGVNIQQAIEKYLKGYLLSKGWKLRRVHDLEVLLNEAISYDPSFEDHFLFQSLYHQVELHNHLLRIGLLFGIK